jgi:MFS family permease
VTAQPRFHGAPDRALPVTAILALSLAHLLAMADRSIFSAIAPLLAQRYGFTDTQLGILLGPALAVTYGIAAIGFGTLTDRSMPRTLVTAGLSIMVAASAVMALADSYAMLLMGRILLGLGQAALIPAAMVLVVRTPYGVARPQVLATFTGASALGRSGGLIAAGVVLGAAASFGIAPEAAGWRILLLLTTLPAIVLLLACLRMLPVARHTITPAPSATPRATRHLVLALAPQFAVAIGPILLGQSLAAWVPVLLIRQHGFAAPAAATFFGVILLVMATGAQYLGSVMTARMR